MGLAPSADAIGPNKEALGAKGLQLILDRVLPPDSEKLQGYGATDASMVRARAFVDLALPEDMKTAKKTLIRQLHESGQLVTPTVAGKVTQCLQAAPPPGKDKNALHKKVGDDIRSLTHTVRQSNITGQDIQKLIQDLGMTRVEFAAIPALMKAAGTEKPITPNTIDRWRKNAIPEWLNTDMAPDKPLRMILETKRADALRQRDLEASQKKAIPSSLADHGQLALPPPSSRIQPESQPPPSQPRLRRPWEL